ncbi:MAG: class I SAM-dependent methyltransferase, partial [Candidatus Omnitrophica bacterium]|nr:class I SAM-dependent methyltransferase [Candidatus Omnitrophota bacterium]
MSDNSRIEDYERGGTQKQTYLASEVEHCLCPFCDNANYRQLYKERGCLGIVRCSSCGLIYVNPRLKSPEKIYWGQADKYFKEAKLIFEGKARHHRDPNYISDLKLISRHKPSGNLLDIGTNMGFFLRHFKGRKWDLYGVEPSPSLAEIARRYFGLNVKTGFLENAGFKDNFFDVVTMTDVFEHIAEPQKILGQIKRIIKPDGVVLIKVPNGLFNLLKLHLATAGKRLKNYDLFDSYEHLVHYSHSSLRDMLKKYGFKIIKTTIDRPIQTPVWHNYLGQYYQYPTPWVLDARKQSLRVVFYWLSLCEFWIRRK